ncbi:MAG TPA: hypothetical protein VIL66_06835 [Bacillota bacterium]
MRRRRFPGEYIGRSQLSQAQRARGGRLGWPNGASSSGKLNTDGLNYPDPWGDWANYPLVAWPQPNPGRNQPPGYQKQPMNAYHPPEVNFTPGYFMSHAERQGEEILSQPASFRSALPLDTESFGKNKRTEKERPAATELPSQGEEGIHSNWPQRAEDQGGEELERAHESDQEDAKKTQTRREAENLGFPQQTTDAGRTEDAGSEESEEQSSADQESVTEPEMDGNNGGNIPQKEKIIVWRTFPKRGLCQ